MQRHNFTFLEAHVPEIANHAACAESYLRENPAATLWLLRVFAESIAKRILAQCDIDAGKNPKFEDLIKKLRSAGRVKVSEKIIDEINLIRVSSNPAVHSGLAKRVEAEGCLRRAHSLAGRYVRLFCDKDFDPPAFVVPPNPRRASDELQEKLKSAESWRKAVEEENAILRRREAEALAALAARPESLTELRAREIQRQMDLEDKNSPASLNWDRPSVWLELSNQLHHFVGRERDLQVVRQWRSSATPSDYLLVVGPPGYGKSAFMAKIAESLYDPAPDEGGAGQAAVLLDMPCGGRDPRTVLQFLLWQAWNLSKREAERPKYSGSISALRDSLLRTLAALGEDGTVLLVVDGVDELVEHRDHPAKELQFLPEHLPRGVKAVLSCRPNDAITDHLERQLSHPQKLQLEPLPASTARDFLFKRLDPSAFLWLESMNVQRVLKKTDGVPLYLRYVADKAASAIREHKDSGPRCQVTVLTDAWVPSSLEDLFRDVYRDIEQATSNRRGRGRHLRKTLAHLLALSFGGSSISELVSALKALGVAASTPQVRQAMGEIDPYVRKESENRYSLYHHAFSEYVAEFLGPDGRALVYRALAQPIAGEAAEQSDSVVRRLRYALEWHAEARRANEVPSAVQAATTLGNSLVDFATLANLMEHDHLFDIVPLLSRAADECATDLDSQAASLLKSWARLINDQLAVLSGRPWLLFQIAVNADAVAIATAANEWAGVWDRPCLRRVTGGQLAIDHDYPRIRSFPHTDGIEEHRCISVSAEAGTVALLRGERVGCWQLESGRSLWTADTRRLLPDSLICISNSGRFVALPTYDYEYSNDSRGEEWDGSDPIDVQAGLVLYGGQDGRTIWNRALRIPGFVRAITFTPDDEYLFLGSGDPRFWNHCIAEEGRGTICKVDVQAGTVVATQRGLAPIGSLLLSPNGEVLVSAASEPAGDERLHVRLDFWDARKLASLRIVTLESSSVVALAGYGPNSLVAMGDDGRMRVLSFAGDQILSIDTGDFHVKQVVALSARKLVFTLSRSERLGPVQLKCWDLSAGVSIAETQYPHFALDAIALAPGDQELLMASQQQLSLNRIALATKPPAILSADRKETGHVVATSPDLRSVAFEGQEGTLDIRDPVVFRQLHEIQSPGSVPEKSKRVTPSRSRRVVALSSADRYAFVAYPMLDGLVTIMAVYNLARDTMMRFLPLPGVEVLDASFACDGTRLALLTRSRLLEPEEREFVRSCFADAIRDLTAASASDSPPREESEARTSWPEIAHAAGIGNKDTSVSVIDIERSQLIARFTVDRDSPAKMRLAPDGSAVALIGRTWVQAWDIECQSKILDVGADREDGFRRGVRSVVDVLAGPEAALANVQEVDFDAEFEPSTLGFSSDSGSLFVGGNVRVWIHLVRRWNLRAREELAALPVAASGPLTTTRDGRYLLAGVHDGLSMRSLVDGHEVLFWPTGLPPIAIAVRDEGRIALVDKPGNTVVLEHCE